ncbi:MAG: PQ-loop repeat-containing protein [Acidimicrobiales bacterium]|nr:PQ-loop repeat-containing protein [Acidimicrobiales bacterium]
MDPELLGWLASAVFLVRLLPQPIRLWRTGTPQGVSPLAAMNSALSDLAWLLYGLGAGLVPVWLVAVLALPPGIWTVVLLRRRTSRGDLLLAGLWLATILVAAYTGGLVALLGVSVLVNQGPQVLEALRSDDLRGVAAPTWWIALADATLWGSYGVVVGDAAVVAYGVVLFACATTILVRLWVTRRVPRVSQPEPAVAFAD